jgi:hypothetical protein
MPRLQVHDREPAVKERHQHVTTILQEPDTNRTSARIAGCIGKCWRRFEIEEAADLPPGASRPHQLRDRLTTVGLAVLGFLWGDIGDIDALWLL